MRILVTGAGGPSAISVWKSLGGHHELHMADMDPCATGLYLVPPDQRIIVPRGDDPAFVPAVRDICTARAIDVMIPTVDAELVPLALASDKFSAMNVKLALAPLESLRLCRDKHVLLTALAPVVPVPESEPLTEALAAGTISFPRFAKPRRGAGSSRAVIVRSRSDLDVLPKDGSFLLQELLPGEEYSIDVYVRGDGRTIAAVPRERMKTDSGIAVAARTVRDPVLINAAIRAAEAAGIRYVANVQFKRSAGGAYKLLEINPRFPGTLPLTDAAGVDLPALLIAELSGQPLPETLVAFKEIMVVRYWSERFIDPQEWRDLCRR
jgi:carbamoyl-phosphate synthase large subunit